MPTYILILYNFFVSWKFEPQKGREEDEKNSSSAQQTKKLCFVYKIIYQQNRWRFLDTWDLGINQPMQEREKKICQDLTRKG